MKVLRISLAVVLTSAWGYRAYGQDAPPAPPPAVEEVAPPPTQQPGEDVLQTEDVLRGSGIPTAPYPAGLSYMMTPQPFRVPYPNRIYYPIPHYVRQCPYYPKGFYWGADWNKHLLGHNPWLIHGSKRFNPYLTDAKIRHHSPAARQAASAHRANGPCPHCQSQSLVRRNPSPEADEFEIPQAPVASRSKQAGTPTSRRSSLVLREPPHAESNEAEPDDNAESDEFAPPPPPSVKRPSAQPKNRLVRQPLPSWQRPPVVRR